MKSIRLVGSPLAVAALATALCAGACAQVSGNGATDGTGSGGSNGGPGTGSGGTTGGGTSTGGTSVGVGGMGGTIIGAGGGGGEKSCGLQFFDLERKPGDVVLVLDRSASMQKNSQDKDVVPPELSKWDQIIPSLTDVVGQSGGMISWGLKNFPEDGSECASATVSTKIDLMVTPLNSAALVSAIQATQPNGNGTPTGAAVRVAADYLTGLQDNNRKYLLLATDGQPSCSGTAGALSKSTDAARTDAVAAVTSAAGTGIHTFVLGVATKASDADTLNMLAVAGLEPRADPNPLATKYYLGNSIDELKTALGAITGAVTQSCVFTWDNPPPVPEKIAVKVSGSKAPLDPSHTDGWDYTGPDHLGVEVFGSWCEMIKTTAANKVEVVFGCPDIDIP